VALQGPIPVEFALVFPDGVYAAGIFEPVRDFDASSNGRFVQSKDKATGLPLWTVEVIDAAGPAGSPFTPVEFTGLTVTPYVNQNGKLGYSLKATGVRAPAAGRAPSRHGVDGKEGAA
jgi:hypothetical protein